MILLDTHVLIWLDTGDANLGPTSRSRIEAAFQEDELAISAVSFWEISMLVEKGRLSLRIPILDWRRSLLTSGLEEIAFTGEIGARAARLARFHGDPADRFITMTAIAHRAKLVTADGRILAWEGELSRIDARR